MGFPTWPDYYETPKQSISILSRLFPSAVAYNRFARIIWRYSIEAKRGRYADQQWYDNSLELLRAMEQTGAQIIFENMSALERVPKPFVLIGNHMSMLETMLLPCMILPFSKVTFVVKRNLVEVPVFKHIMKATRPTVVDRVNPRDDFKTVMEEGVKQLSAGISYIVFPQSTRAAHFDPEQFNSIGMKLALKAGVPVLPLALKTDALQNGKWIKDLGKFDTQKPIRFAFGEPILKFGPGGRDEHEQVRDFIQLKLASWEQDKMMKPCCCGSD
jgi:1-acyl-sn-glycerol-3-phosphate acyltransferase